MDKERILRAGNCYCPYCLKQIGCNSNKCHRCGANIMQPIKCIN